MKRMTLFLIACVFMLLSAPVMALVAAATFGGAWFVRTRARVAT